MCKSGRESAAVRPFARGDADGAYNVEKTCLYTAWSRDQIEQCAENGTLYFVAEGDDGRVVGIVSAVCACGECEVMNLAVLPEHRKRGTALALLNAAAGAAAERGADRIVLEVAEDNAAALALYKKAGFRAAGRRVGFYRGRDALIMEKKL